MANEIKLPSVPLDYFGSSYQQLIHANNLIQKGSSKPTTSSAINNIELGTLGFRPQEIYDRESELWRKTKEILKSLLDQETKKMVSERIVDI